jgi:hypothetical protein
MGSDHEKKVETLAQNPEISLLLSTLCLELVAGWKPF